MKRYYDEPKQVKFYDEDGDHYVGCIAFQDHIICGCCGGLFSIEEICDGAPTGVEPIIDYEYWCDLSNDIMGDDLDTEIDSHLSYKPVKDDCDSDELLEQLSLFDCDDYDVDKDEDF